MPPLNPAESGPKNRHLPEDPFAARLLEDGFTVARLVVAASDKSPDGHASRLGCPHTTDAVLDHEGALRIGLHPFGCVEKEIRRRLASLHHLRGKELSGKVGCQASQ